MPDSAGIAAYTNVFLSGFANQPAKPKTQERARPAGKSFFARLTQKDGGDTEMDEAAVLESRLRELGRDEAVGVLLDEVHSAGNVLKERPFPDEIKRYKQAVRGFMRYVLKNSYEVDMHINRAKQKKTVQIIVIDKKLEQLAAGILSGQITQLSLLERIDEIRGLLVDMLN
ncbi:MAG: YaaR family protein [Spirochaetaceae bacterium]|jgi:uncharacterized protein YaaR (DUF327 family)|nr:YaaR family protein [Spirochaetaceae bacterium]